MIRLDFEDIVLSGTANTSRTAFGQVLWYLRFIQLQSGVCNRLRAKDLYLGTLWLDNWYRE